MKETEFDICLDKICRLIPDFLNDCEEDKRDENLINIYTEKFARQFSLDSAQRAAVYIILENLEVCHDFFTDAEIFGHWVGIQCNEIARIILKRYDEIVVGGKGSKG